VSRPHAARPLHLGRLLLPRTLIWNSRWVTDDGIIESQEAFALPADPHTVVVVRRIRAFDGPTRIRAPPSMYGPPSDPNPCAAPTGRRTARGRGTRARSRSAGRAPPGAHRAGAGPLSAELEIKPGQPLDLVLELSDRPLEGKAPDPTECWSATEASWSLAVPMLEDGVLGRRDAEMAMAVLNGLTSIDGGMVAAATISLPERAQGNRNYDYRYAWIRDQCYAGKAVAVRGHFPLLDASVSFVSSRLLEDGPELKPAYTITGGAVPDERELSHLVGYPGGTDKVGNWVNQQFQLDAFGEALELLATASALDRLTTEHWDAVQTAVAAIERRWKEPDAGIWELENQRWAHSRLTCVSGLRAIARQAPGPRSGRWSGLADAILADAAKDCLHPSGRSQRAPGDQRIDAALLMPGIRHALAASDPRTTATVNAVVAELMGDDYVYRFAHDARPLGEAEGAFLLCGFLLTLALEQQGDHLAARALFERNRSAGGTPGLMAEEFDVAQHQLRGNLPQAFVHALLLECSAELNPERHPPRTE
jgi:alpha,alpha-trehalase